MKILVAVDGSEYSHKVLEKAKLLAAALKGEVTILTVVDPLKEVSRVQQKRMKDILREVAFNEGEAILKNASEFFKDFPGTFNTIQKEGDPAEQIVLHAEEVNYDFVIMGSRGRGAFSRTLLGSVSDKVVHHINRPIIIVK
ncbi:universal stress protein [Soehngenia saccharolytica]|nr:universal stress protein [Soehngenia saccharolytica]